MTDRFKVLGRSALTDIDSGFSDVKASTLSAVQQHREDIFPHISKLATNYTPNDLFLSVHRKTNTL